ncbi:MAG: hypothetical protein ACSHYB_15225 [Roseibacillus sp.]
MKALRIILGLLFVWFLVASSAALDLKTPPPNGIYDPSNFLGEDFIQDVAYQISYEEQHRQFEIFLIIFEEEPSQGASILAKQAGESWSKGEWWAVIYQVGAEGEPDCLAGGKLVKQLPADTIDRTVKAARNTALLVRAPKRRLEEMVTNLADGFGFLYVKAKQNYETAVEEFDKRQEAKRKKKETRMVYLSLALVFLLALAAVGFSFWKKHLRKMKPMEFPQTSPRRRLAAPFSGGGDVLVNYGRKH